MKYRKIMKNGIFPFIVFTLIVFILYLSYTNNKIEYFTNNSYNRKICTFTQTHSNNRDELFKFHNKDIPYLKFINSFDKNFFAFHNSPDDYIDKITNNDFFKNINNLEIIKYNNITYPQTFKRTLEKCKNDGYDYIIFLQDDVYSTENTDYDDLIYFIKNGAFNMLNIEQIIPSTNIHYSKNTLNIYSTSSSDFKNFHSLGTFAFDDGPYVANIDYILQNIYDDAYFNKPDIWSAELYLAHEKIKNNPIERLTCNLAYFSRVNIVGTNGLDNRDKHIKQLKSQFNME